MDKNVERYINYKKLFFLFGIFFILLFFSLTLSSCSKNSSDSSSVHNNVVNDNTNNVNNMDAVNENSSDNSNSNSDDGSNTNNELFIEECMSDPSQDVVFHYFVSDDKVLEIVKTKDSDGTGVVEKLSDISKHKICARSYVEGKEKTFFACTELSNEDFSSYKENIKEQTHGMMADILKFSCKKIPYNSKIFEIKTI